MMILAVFRSRTHSLDYLERLHRYGVDAATAPAPREAHIGCGLCVTFDARLLPRAQAILKTGNYPSFKGFYKKEFVGGRVVIKPISAISGYK